MPKNKKRAKSRHRTGQITSLSFLYKVKERVQTNPEHLFHCNLIEIYKNPIFNKCEMYKKKKKWEDEAIVLQIKMASQKKIKRNQLFCQSRT